MTDTGSSRTKSLTDTTVSASTLNPLADRWSNNISYRQLIISSCIGIAQFWWHPYVHDLTRLLPFLFLYNVFSIIIGYPLFYLELALGIVTRKGVVTCWDLAPMARGVGVSMLMVSMWTALATGLVATWSLALLVHSFHAFLPWLHCAASANPPCAARHRPLPPGSDTPAQSFFFNLVLNLKRDGLKAGMGTIVPELAFYYVVCWILIYGIAIKRIYSYSKLVLFKDVMAYFVVLCCALGVYRLHGAGKMFLDADWSVLLSEIQIWREAVEYALVEMTVAQGSLVMLGTYCPKQQHALARTALLAFAASKTSSMAVALYGPITIWREAVEYALVEMTVAQGSLVMLGTYCPKQQHALARTALLAFAASKTSSMAVAFTLGAVHGALHKDYENSTNIWSATSSSMILWADYVARIPGSQFWSVIVFFTLLTLALSSTALLVQTTLSTLTGRSIRHISWAFLVLLCFLFCVIGVITLCTQGGLYMLNFIMAWPVTKPRMAVAAMVAAIVTFVYGQTTFCEDVYFAVGEYPCVFLRVCWAVAPLILFCTFWTATAPGFPDAGIGWAVVSMAIIPMFIILLFYLIFKIRVRNIVRTEK